MTRMQCARTCACLLWLVPCCATSQTEDATPSAQPNEARVHTPNTASALPGPPNPTPSWAPPPKVQSPAPTVDLPDPNTGAAPAPAAIANPASEHCKAQGGRVQFGEDKDGNQVGFCVFPDGSRCEEWALFRRQCSPGTQR